MNAKDRLQYLIRRHRDLDEEIQIMYEARQDDGIITEMKKLKMKIKEQIEQTKRKIL